MVQTKLPKDSPVWLVCQNCVFEMKCASEQDGWEIATAHVKSGGHHRVDVIHTLEGYKQVMSEKTLPPATAEYPQNQKRHRSRYALTHGYEKKLI